MVVLQVYNQQRSLFGGESSVISTTMKLLQKHGHASTLYMKSSRGVDRSLTKRIKAFFGGVYSVTAYKEMLELLKKELPDLVHVHSVYPMFSPSVLVACRRAGVPVVMTVHSQILTCPNWYHLYRGTVCEECVGGHEYRCALKNCRQNYLESLAYALRSGFARTFKLFQDNVTVFIALTNFSKKKLINAGFREEQIAVVPNAASLPDVNPRPSEGKYAAYAGRLSPEKGLGILMAAAYRCPEIPVRVAGGGTMLPIDAPGLPKNVQFVGRLDHSELAAFYQKARFLVVPSVCYEQQPLVAIEAMLCALPVIASRIGGLPEVVEDGVSGLLFQPGNAEDLAYKMKALWASPTLCKEFGQAGRRKATLSYSEDTYYTRLMSVYLKAIEMSS
jgi:glycosyltransferase involved in cell wall biosynthesis